MKKVLLGHAAVDSGQLMITDPCYINRQWKANSDNIVSVNLWGAGHNEVYDHLKEKFPGVELEHKEHVITAKVTDEVLADKILSEGYMHSIRIGKKIVFNKETDSTYDQICNITDNDNQGGPIPFKAGHEGFLVAFRSGLGDGMYPVYATIEDVPGWGERVTKVEIELVNMDEDEENQNEA